MQIRDFWRVVSKWWWLILLVAAVAALASYGYTRTQTRIYRSTVRLTVSPSRLDYGLTLVIESQIQQYTQELQTRQLAGIVDDKLKLDLPIDMLLGEVKVSADMTNYVINMTVDSTDPNDAKNIAQTWANEFIQEHQDQMAPIDPSNRINVKLLDNPVPGVLYYPKTRQIVAAAAVLGLVAGAIGAFLIEYFDDTIKTSDDVERFAALTVVGSIPTFGAVRPTPSNGRVAAGTLGGKH